MIARASVQNDKAWNQKNWSTLLFVPLISYICINYNFI